MSTATAAEKKIDLAEEGFADIEEAADFLSMSRSSIYKLMDSGRLRYAKFGKARRIPWRALKEYANLCLSPARFSY